LKLLIAYGSLGKLFHLEEFSHALEKQNVQVKLVKDTDFSRGFPSKKISDWFNGDKKFKELIREFKPDGIFADRQSHFALHAIKSEVPTFILLRGHYWQEYFWGMKTLGNNFKNRVAIWFRNKIAEEVFERATAILPICKYLEDVVKERYPKQNTGVFLEGINSALWYHTEKMKLQHPCIGLVQDANWWGKTKELLVLEQVLEKMPNVFFYWVGDGPYRKKITDKLEKFDNFKWLGRLDYPDNIRKFLETIDVYALITGMDLAPLTLKEAQLMEKPVIATDVGGDKEMMVDKKTGFLVKEGDANDIIKKLSRILENKQMATEMGKEGVEFIKKQFNWDRVAKNFLEIIKPYVKTK
jgi:glycosyltransferase involved in cell wall biosynthesis|tara:strand:+ start:950 stop:2014 length:1065 start_codon:yes stop_codon:yes gene_type:complete